MDSSPLTRALLVLAVLELLLAGGLAISRSDGNGQTVDGGVTPTSGIPAPDPTTTVVAGPGGQTPTTAVPPAGEQPPPAPTPAPQQPAPGEAPPPAGGGGEPAIPKVAAARLR